MAHLQHLACDELMTRLTLNTKVDLVVLLTVGGAIPEEREGDREKGGERERESGEGVSNVY